MNRVVVTGASSMLGVALINECIRRETEVLAIVRPKSKNLLRIPVHPLVTIKECDIWNYGELYKEFSESREVDTFYHLAWTSSRKEDRNNVEMQRANVYYTKKAIIAAKRMGCKQFIGAGSQAEYGEMYSYVDENSPCAPITEYGKSKYMAYEEGKLVAEEKCIDFTWVRIFSLYGPFDHEDTLIRKLINGFLHDEEIKLSSCNQIWDYLFSEDAATVFYELGKVNASGLFCLGSGRPQPLKKYVKIAAEQFDLVQKHNGFRDNLAGASRLLSFGEIGSNSMGTPIVAPEIRKLKDAINFTPKISFEEGIRKVIEWVKEEY